jgi:hypothetical protein
MNRIVLAGLAAAGISGAARQAQASDDGGAQLEVMPEPRRCPQAYPHSEALVGT